MRISTCNSVERRIGPLSFALLAPETLHPGFCSENSEHEFRKAKVCVKCWPTKSFTGWRHFNFVQILGGCACDPLGEIGWKGEHGAAL